jgi:hypothetical protein
MLIDLETGKVKKASAFRNTYDDIIIRIVEG